MWLGGAPPYIQFRPSSSRGGILTWRIYHEVKQKTQNELNSPNIIRFYSETHFKSCTILFLGCLRCLYPHVFYPVQKNQ